ncbi:MAG: SurA N-terminal domain-containing protein [Pseudomonadota bacterium]
MKLGQGVALGTMIFSLLFCPVKAEAKIVDRIVATVNGQIITMKEINQRLEPYVQTSGITDEVEINAVRRKILDALIDQVLLEQEARRLDIKVGDDEVEGAIERLKEAGNMTQEQFEARVVSQGGTLGGVRDDVKAEILRARVINQEIRSRVIVPPEKVEEILHAQKGEAKLTEMAHIRNILLSLGPKAGQEEIKSRVALAEKIIQEIKDGLDFTKAAEKYSDGPNAAQGGEMGLISWDDMAPNIRESLEKIEPGQFTEPLVVGEAVQFFQLVSRVTEDARATEEELTRIKKNLADEIVEEKVGEWLKQLREHAIIKIKF